MIPNSLATHMMKGGRFGDNWVEFGCSLLTILNAVISRPLVMGLFISETHEYYCQAKEGAEYRIQCPVQVWTARLGGHHGLQ